MIEITFKGLVSLESARKWPLYPILCFSFMSSASIKQVFFSMKDELVANLMQILIFYIICYFFINYQ